MFYVLLKGAGVGCDYTIGCNGASRKLKAATREEAHREALAVLAEYGEPGCWSQRVESALVLEVVGEQFIDVGVLRDEARAAALTEQEAKDKDARKAEFERLRKEFGG